MLPFKYIYSIPYKRWFALICTIKNKKTHYGLLFLSRPSVKYMFNSGSNCCDYLSTNAPWRLLLEWQWKQHMVSKKQRWRLLTCTAAYLTLLKQFPGLTDDVRNAWRLKWQWTVEFMTQNHLQIFTCERCLIKLHFKMAFLKTKSYTRCV